LQPPYQAPDHIIRGRFHVTKGSCSVPPLRAHLARPFAGRVP
jgi:hypothetical protein